MKNKLWKQWMISGVLVSAMVVSGGVSVSVQAEETTETEEAVETDSSAESEDDLQILFDQAVEDAMIAEDGEILPVVSLDEGEPYAVYNEEGRVLLYTFHKYPDSYPDGTDVKLEWGNVWTFTGGELEDWYQENKEGVTDWQTRMKELLGLTPDNESNYVTAMWVKPEDVFRPAGTGSWRNVHIRRDTDFAESSNSKHGLMRTLFPAIMMANIHGQDWDILMTGRIMDRLTGCLSLSLNRIVM